MILPVATAAVTWLTAPGEMRIFERPVTAAPHKVRHRHHRHHPRPVPPAPAPPAVSASSPYPGGSFGACVRERESQGNPSVMNSSGHYGLYQFSAATWAAYGGNPADFGDASVAEQNEVFANAMAAGGESNWAPYDGC